MQFGVLYKVILYESCCELYSNVLLADSWIIPENFGSVCAPFGPVGVWADSTHERFDIGTFKQRGICRHKEYLTPWRF